MTVTIRDISKCLDTIAPTTIAEPWDNVGLLIGSPERTVRSILVGLDPTINLLDEAIEAGADTVITHHPAIFKPLPTINTAEPTGRFLEKALIHSINVFACHTNFDSTAPGVNDILLNLLGLECVGPLVPDSSQPVDGVGTGRIGRYNTSISRTDFIKNLFEILNLPSVQVAGTIPKTISTVAICGGSGSEFAATAQQSGADLYITAEVKHNVARWAEEAGFCIIDGTHFATEKPAIQLLTQNLMHYAEEHNWNIVITESTTERHPFYQVDQNSIVQSNN